MQFPGDQLENESDYACCADSQCGPHRCDHLQIMALFIGNDGKDSCTYSADYENAHHLALPTDRSALWPLSIV
ncbi:MAG: hypothetical protein CMN39_06120 [SAR116 cluster bacterium]|nr:hypothetical protein [SAR116 cluster bacterium]